MILSGKFWNDELNLNRKGYVNRDQALLAVFPMKSGKPMGNQRYYRRAKSHFSRVRQNLLYGTNFPCTLCCFP